MNHLDSSSTDRGVPINVLLPAELPDRNNIRYTLENLFRPFAFKLFYITNAQYTEDVQLILPKEHGAFPVCISLQELRKAFDRISGKTENHFPKDAIGRVDESFLDEDFSRPGLSEWICGFVKKLGPWPLQRESLKPRLKVHVTHDVDRLNPYEPVGLIRRLSVSTRGVGPSFSARCRDLLNWLRNGRSFAVLLETLMRIERAEGIQATYFCMSGPYSFQPFGSRSGDCTKSQRAENFFRMIRRYGHRLGLHGCAYSLRKGNYKDQREALSQAFGVSVTWHRNHYLVWDPLKSPGLLRRAGIKVDSTVGFHRRQGFRAGLAWPYELWDHGLQEPSGVLEIPMVFMDAAGVMTHDGPSWNDLYALLERAESLMGEVAVNFHPEYFVGHPSILSRYQEFLEWLRLKGFTQDGYCESI